MKYIDLHCDALTKEGVAAVSGESLKRGDCLLQCFAAFVDGTRGEGFSRAIELCGAFEKMCAREGLHCIRKASDLKAEGGNAFLTLEGGEGIGDDIQNLDVLYARNVRMIGLTWNRPNLLGACAVSSRHPVDERSGRPHPPLFSRRPLRGGAVAACNAATEGVYYGLTPFGRDCVEKMLDLKILPDAAHGSDDLLLDVAALCKRRGAPFAVSHTGARAVFPHPRNLSDEGIRAVAENGGTVGMYFVPHFLSCKDDEQREALPSHLIHDAETGGDAEEQREAILSHAKHILNVGGEDVLSIGSDFDGAPSNPFVPSPEAMPRLLELFSDEFGARIAEKIASRNVLRLFSFL